MASNFTSSKVRALQSQERLRNAQEMFAWKDSKYKRVFNARIGERIPKIYYFKRLNLVIPQLIILYPKG